MKKSRMRIITALLAVCMLLLCACDQTPVDPVEPETPLTSVAIRVPARAEQTYKDASESLRGYLAEAFGIEPVMQRGEPKDDGGVELIIRLAENDGTLRNRDWCISRTGKEIDIVAGTDITEAVEYFKTHYIGEKNVTLSDGERYLCADTYEIEVLTLGEVPYQSCAVYYGASDEAAKAAAEHFCAVLSEKHGYIVQPTVKELPPAPAAGEIYFVSNADLDESMTVACNAVGGGLIVSCGMLLDFDACMAVMLEQLEAKTENKTLALENVVFEQRGETDNMTVNTSLSPKQLAELIASVSAGMAELNKKDDIADTYAYNDPAVRDAYLAIAEGYLPGVEKGDHSAAELTNAAVDSIYDIYRSATSRLAKIAALNLYKKARMAISDSRYDAATAEKLYTVTERIKEESRAQFTGRSDVTPGTTEDADPNEKYYRYSNGTFIREVTIKSNKEGMKPLEIIQISDIHQKWINEDDKTENDPALMETANNRLPYYQNGRTGDELDYIAHSDMTISTGDVIDYLSYGTLEVSQRDLFEADVNMLASVGNHEFSKDFASTVNKDTSSLESRREMLEQFWCNDIDYHSQVLGERVLVIILNNALMSYTEEQYVRLACDLAYACENNLIVLLFQHVPLNTANPDDQYVEFISVGDVGGATQERWHNFYSSAENIGNNSRTTGATEKVYNLIRSSADVIKGVFCGHTHQDIYTEILGTDEDGSLNDTVIPQYVLKGNFYSGNGILMKIIVE